LPRRGSACVVQPLSIALSRDFTKTYLYHITDVSNIPSIVANGGLLSDCALAGVAHQVIGYPNIKERRMTQYRVPCCGNRFVGEFVPFYFCPRSPMLYTVNRGNTGRPPGCQTSIVHLVTTVRVAANQGRAFAISDGNAGLGTLRSGTIWLHSTTPIISVGPISIQSVAGKNALQAGRVSGG